MWFHSLYAIGLTVLQGHSSSVNFSAEQIFADRGNIESVEGSTLMCHTYTAATTDYLSTYARLWYVWYHKRLWKQALAQEPQITYAISVGNQDMLRWMASRIQWVSFVNSALIQLSPRCGKLMIAYFSYWLHAHHTAHTSESAKNGKTQIVTCDLGNLIFDPWYVFGASTPASSLKVFCISSVISFALCDATS